MPKLFTMYTQLNKEQDYGKEGTGIGLVLSKSIVERMGGSVNVESEYGKGSTFRFLVPQKCIKRNDIISFLRFCFKSSM